MAKAIESTPRRASTIAAAIAPKPIEPEPALYEKLTITTESGLRERANIRLATLRVSESALHDAALRIFLDLPDAQQREALRGAGKRRKVAK